LTSVAQISKYFCLKFANAFCLRTGAYSSVHREEILAEMALLISLGNHDNVLGLIGVCTSQFFPQDEEWSPLLVTEYMPYGDLLHFLWESREVNF